MTQKVLVTQGKKFKNDVESETVIVSAVVNKHIPKPFLTFYMIYLTPSSRK